MRPNNDRLPGRTSTPLHAAIWLAAVLLLALATPVAQAQNHWGLTCGGAHQRACGEGDWEWDAYYSQPNYSSLEIPPFFFSNSACDLALVDVNGTCESKDHGSIMGGQRRMIGTFANSGWIGFAMQSQRAIQADQVMNWTTIFGTHNSFSNYQDGAFDANIGQYDGNFEGISTFNLNVDQEYSMSDQMDAGARIIRMDPLSYDVLQWKAGESIPSGLWFYDSELRMCHQSANPDLECDFTSYGRPFAYGVNEVEDWLKQNPGEILVIRLNRTPDADMRQVDYELEEGLEVEGFGILHPPGSSFNDNWDPKTQGWPTLREMRAMNKRVIILSPNGSELTFPWNWVMGDGYTDAAGFNNCQNQDGVDMRVTPPPSPSNPVPRAWNNWSYIGEDRSGSNYLVAPDPVMGGAGLLDAASVTRATNCGFGLINVDFLLAGSNAPVLSHSIDIGVPTVTINGTTLGIHIASAFNATKGITPDTRREAAIWSWDQGELGLFGPAYMKPNGRWGSAGGTISLHYACAIGQGNLQTPANYKWVMSEVEGPWSNGPQACKAVGGTFWAPQSPLENQNLKAATNGRQVWLNFSTSSNVILEPVSPQLSSAPVDTADSEKVFVINVTRGQLAASIAPVFQYTAGVGGPLTVQFDPTTPRLLNGSFFSIDTRAKTISLHMDRGIADNSGYINLAPGTYTQGFVIGEGQPGGFNDQFFSLVLKVAPAPDVKITVKSLIPGEQINVDGVAVTTPHIFLWAPDSVHSLGATSVPSVAGVKWVFYNWSDGNPNPVRSFVVPVESSSITADFIESFKLTLTPANGGSFTVTPASADGFYASYTLITVTANPNADFYFTGFTGQIVSQQNSVQFRMTAPITVNAIFAHDPKVIVDSESAGQIMFVDGVKYTPPHSFIWAPGSVHELDAPSSNQPTGYKSIFTGWSDGAPYPVRTYTVPTQGGRVVAQFNQYALVSLIPTSNGQVTVSPASPIGGGFYLLGSSVSFSAAPALGYKFTGFTGNAIAGTANPHTVQIGKPITVGANFATTN